MRHLAKRLVEESFVVLASWLPRRSAPLGAARSASVRPAGCAATLELEVELEPPSDAVGIIRGWIGDRQVVDQEVGVEWVRLPWGGERAYFRCPYCGRRSERLYWPPFVAGAFACRTCHDLTYRSTRDKPARTVAWLRGVAAGLTQDFGLPPDALALGEVEEFLSKTEAQRRREWRRARSRRSA